MRYHLLLFASLACCLSFAQSAVENSHRLKFTQGMGYLLPSEWAVSEKASLRLSDAFFVSEAGEIAVIEGKDLDQVTAPPADGWAKKVEIERLRKGVGVVRLQDGLLIRFQVADVSSDGSVTIAYLPSLATPAQPGQKPGKEPVQQPKGLDSRLVGSWNMRIPTGVVYDPYQPGRPRTLSIIPGAEFGRITVKADMTYIWEGISRSKPTVKGKLVPHKPWFAMKDQRFYKVSDGKDTYLIGWISTNRRPFSLVNVEGGFVAGGDKVTKK